MKVAALIVAAGSGTRAGGDVPKQYQMLAGTPMLRSTISHFAQHKSVDLIQCVIAEGAEVLFEKAAEGFAVLPPVTGGATRGASVRAGLKALAAHGVTHVLIHDGARATVDEGTISRVIEALAISPGAIAALPVTDTLKSDASGNAATGPARDGLWRAQTPQGFAYDAIVAAYETAPDTLTDDAAVAEAAGLDVRLVMGSEDNIKITRAEDFARAEAILNARQGGGMMETRTGLGIDVHRFEPGDHVMLCGVAIPFDRKLAGHSDADVGLHALTDAILGAIAEGDIGAHFPPSDETWRGASSDRFLAHACALTREKRGRIVHLDLTLICEAPKVGPHREAMRARVAEICGLGVSAVSIKATTTEKLGFTGRGEGIEARAVATIELPRGEA